MPYFRGDLYFCSNFYETPVTLQGRTYRCAEAAFQAQKDPSQADLFVPLNGGEAKRLGTDRSRTHLRSDWDSVKVDVMRQCLDSKFSEPTLRKRLAKTEAPLVEETNNDAYWGTVSGHGENMLGRLLMDKRDQIRAELGLTPADRGQWPPAPGAPAAPTSRLTVQASVDDVYVMANAQTARVKIPWPDAPSGFAVMVTDPSNVRQVNECTYDVSFDANAPIRLVNVHNRRNPTPTWSVEARPEAVRDAMQARLAQLSNQMPNAPADPTAKSSAKSRLDRIIREDAAATNGMPTTSAIPVTMRAAEIKEVQVESPTELIDDDYISFDDDSHEDEMEQESFFHEGDDLEGVSFESQGATVVPGLTPTQAADEDFDLAGTDMPFKDFRPITIEDVRLRKNSKAHQPDYTEVTTPQGTKRAIVRIPWEEVPGKLESQQVGDIAYPPRAAIVVPVENVTTTRTFSSGSRDVSIRLTQPTYKVMAYDEQTGNLEPLDDDETVMSSERIAETTQSAMDALQAQRNAKQAAAPRPRRQTMRAIDQMATQAKIAHRTQSVTDPRYLTNVMATYGRGGRKTPRLGISVSTYPNTPDAMRIDVNNLDTRKSIELTVPPLTDQDGQMKPYTAAIRTPYLERVVKQLTAYGIIAPLSVKNASTGEYAHTVFAVRPEAALRLDRMGTEAYERDHSDQDHAGNEHWREMMPQMPSEAEREMVATPVDPNAFFEQMQKLARIEPLSERLGAARLPSEEVDQAKALENEARGRETVAETTQADEKPAPRHMAQNEQASAEEPMDQPK